jgi:hypothetical protein
LINGLWIGHAHDLLPKLTQVEESLIACYRCIKTLIKLKYSNISLTFQKALKENISSFVQNRDAAIALIDSLPTSLKNISKVCNLGFFCEGCGLSNLLCQ